MAGATMLAAAVTFAKRTSVLLPDQPVDPSLEDVSLDPTRVLRNWTPSEMQALLGRALFDESLYGTVRFHHRTAREYLTARWLQDLLQQYKNRRKIQSLLFACPYGVLSEVVVPSMKPIVGWLAAWDEDIRNKTMQVDPTVLLEFGDPSALDIGTRCALLKRYAERCRDRRRTRLNLDVREVRRLADPMLSDVVRKLLIDYRDHDEVRYLMLRIVCEDAVPNCGDLALALALADGMDVHTRSLAVAAVAKGGTPEQRTQLAQALVAGKTGFDGEIVCAGIETLWPEHLSISDVAHLFEAVEFSGRFSAYRLQSEVERLVLRVSESQQRKDLLRACVALLSRPPLHDLEYARISIRYDWLLEPTFILSDSVLTATSSSGYTDIDGDALKALSMIRQARHADMSGDVVEKVIKLIRCQRNVKYALFWYEIEQARLSSEHAITDWWAVPDGLANWDASDVEHLAGALQHRTLQDDKLLALSMLMSICEVDKLASILPEIEKAVAGNPELERALRDHLTPRPLSKEQVEIQKKQEDIKAQSAARMLANENNRRAWIGSLKADPSTVGDLAIAPQGGVTNNTASLALEIRKQAKSRGRFSFSGWELLEPEFGPQVARAYRNFCQAFWRGYEPQLRSEGAGDGKSTPWAVIIGLSGIAMEARRVDGWAASLRDDDAVVATRYALWELNELPSWFASLHQTHSTVVTDILVREMEWELKDPSTEQSAGYVLSRLRWSAKVLGRTLRPDLVALIEAHPNGGATALTEAVTIVLRDASPVPVSFVELAAHRAKEATNNEHKVLWLSVLLCLDAQRGVPALEQWADASRDSQECEQRISAVLGYVWGDRFHSLASEHRDFAQPDVLLRLLKLTYRHVRVEDDIHHKGTYSPGPRDEAQEARGHLLDLLCGIPGRATYDALIELSRFQTSESLKDRMLVLAEQRAEMDAEQAPWAASDIAIFTEDAERDPTTQEQLFKLAVSRIDDLKLDLEEGDESEASLIRKVEDEIELRRVIANRLKHAAHGKYTTGSEEELADQTRTDIRLHNQRVETRIPIEIKIAGKWSAATLRERLENQLVNQYMREAQYGVFLVVNREVGRDKKSWQPMRKRVGFGGLIEWLALEAKGVNSNIKVIGIDLGKRDRAANTKRSSRTKSVKRSKVV